MRDREFLVGMIPLMLQHRWDFGRLLSISTGDQLDLSAREGWEGKVCEAGVQPLGR